VYREQVDDPATLSVESQRVVSAGVQSDGVLLHWLWKETINQLKVLDAAVRDGRGLEEAINFARFVQWSGLAKLMERNACDGELKVDGALVRWKCRELERTVQDAWKGRELARPKPDMEAINYKLDLIAGRLAQLSALPITDERSGPN